MTNDENKIQKYLELYGIPKQATIKLGEVEYIMREMLEEEFLDLFQLQKTMPNLNLDDVAKGNINPEYLRKLFKMLLPQCAISPPIAEIPIPEWLFAELQEEKETSAEGRATQWINNLEATPLALINFTHKNLLLKQIFDLTGLSEEATEEQNSFPDE